MHRLFVTVCEIEATYYRVEIQFRAKKGWYRIGGTPDFTSDYDDSLVMA